MFYVYCGYVSSDSYDASEGAIYKLHQFLTKADVLEFHKEFTGDVHKHCSHVIFRVFNGTELFVRPKTVVETYELVT